MSVSDFILFKTNAMAVFLFVCLVFFLHVHVCPFSVFGCYVRVCFCFDLFLFYFSNFYKVEKSVLSFIFLIVNC